LILIILLNLPRLS